MTVKVGIDALGYRHLAVLEAPSRALCGELITTIAINRRPETDCPACLERIDALIAPTRARHPSSGR